MSVVVWPFKTLFQVLWGLTSFILSAGGRLLALVLGVVFMLLGVVISLTVIGAVLGIPLALFGFALVLRGLF